MPGVKSTLEETATRPRVLVVDDEPSLVELVSDVVRAMDCRIITAGTIAEAKAILASQEIELLVTDVHLPDGDGTSLLAPLHRRHPTASAIVMTGSPSVATAVSALRQGAVDFLPKPFNADDLSRHVTKALEVQALAAKDERKVEKLRVAVKRLNEARKLVSKKVDILCNDLISAYGELSRQVEGVRQQEGFRKTIDEAADLEQLLCHAMDWMLRKIGYSNVAVWLAGEDGEFQLGAYMKYTVAGDPPVTDALRRVVLPLAAREGGEGVVRTKTYTLRDRLSADEAAALGGHELLAINCTYLGESLAALVFFRDEHSPFTAADEALLQSVGPVFAVALAGVVRDMGGAGDGEVGDAADDDATGGAALDERDEGSPGRDGPARGKPRKKRDQSDAADWWKRGEQPPF